MKRKILFALLVASVGLMLASCEREESVYIGVESNDGMSSLDVATNPGISLSKKAVISKIDTVYIYDGLGNLVPHRTIKIRDLKCTFMQEWLFDDLRSDLWPRQIPIPDSIPCGDYYNWNVAFANSDSDEWDYAIVDDNYNSVLGFHIPTIFDIESAVETIGNEQSFFNKIGFCLNGQFPHNTIDYNRGGFWCSVSGHPYQNNVVPGCGVLYGMIGGGTNLIGYNFTNMSYLYARVRLVRTITISQF